MSLRIYVAGGVREVGVVATLMRRLEAVGHVITYDWTTEVLRNIGKGGDVGLSDSDQRRYAELDLEGVRTCEVLWHAVAEYDGSRGAYFEAGAAVAWAKLLVVSGRDWRKSIFHQFAVRKFDTHDEALAWFATINTVRPSWDVLTRDAQ